MSGDRARRVPRPPVRAGAQPGEEQAPDTFLLRLLACAEERDRSAEQRDRSAEARDRQADTRPGDTPEARENRAASAVDRFLSGRDRDGAAGDRASLVTAVRVDSATRAALAGQERGDEARAVARAARERARRERARRTDAPVPD